MQCVKASIFFHAWVEKKNERSRERGIKFRFQNLEILNQVQDDKVLSATLIPGLPRYAVASLAMTVANLNLRPKPCNNRQALDSKCTKALFKPYPTDRIFRVSFKSSSLLSFSIMPAQCSIAAIYSFWL